VRVTRLLGLAALALATTACTPGAAAPSSVPARELEVYAAASLRAVLARVKTAYEAANPGTRLTISTDSSTALETKIEQGAPADVFLSADITNPGKLAVAGLAAGEVVPFAGNLLTVIVPADNPAGITTPADLAKPGVKVIAAAEGVPIQRYTAQLARNLAAMPGYPADFAARYDANVVSREDNAGAIVAKVALGEGDAGVVYVTDARASDTVAAIEIPAQANVPAVYGGIAVKASRQPEAARAFLDWLAGPDGQAILAPFGFRPPTP